MDFDNPVQLPTGLYKVYTGDFTEDPSSDTLLEFALKHNSNVDLVSEVIEKVDLHESNLQSIRNRGLIQGFVYGGSF